MVLTIVLIIVALLLLVGVFVALDKDAYSVFTLSEHKKNPDRFSDLVPWAILIEPTIVMNKNGSLMASFRYRGPDLFSSTKHELIGASARLNNALKRLPGGWAIYAEDDRIRSGEYPHSVFSSPVTYALDQERRFSFKDVEYHENIYHITFNYLPPPDVNSRVGRMFFEGDKENTEENEFGNYLKYFKREVITITNLMGLIFQEMAPLSGDELMTYLHSCVSLSRNNVKVPHTPMYLDSLLCDTPLRGGLSPKLGDCWIQAITVNGFPEESYPGILDEMNRLPFEYKWVTRFIFLDQADAEKQIKSYRQRWLSMRKSLATVLREAMFGGQSAMENTDAVNKAVDADLALQELGSGLICYGHFTQTILLFHKDRKILDQRKEAVERIINGLSFTTIDENLNHNCLDAFLGCIPGNCANNVRHPLLHTLSLVHVFPLSAVWAGPKGDNNLNGEVLMQVVTEGNTPFRFTTAYNDVGHAAIIGPTGSGKSTLLSAMEAAWDRYPNSQVFIFDMLKSSKILTHATGGAFYELGETSCKLQLQPLADIDDEIELSWASEWIRAICEQDGMIVTPEKMAAIWKALKGVADNSREHRTLTALWQKVQDKEVKAVLQAYTLEGAFGNILDGDKETLVYNKRQVFEMGVLIKSLKKAVMPTLTYLFHRLEKWFDASHPTLLVLDEGWLFLDNPVFAPKIKEWLKTLRRYRVYVIFASQSPSDVANSPLRDVIKESCFVKVWLPNPNAMAEGTKEFYQLFDFNSKQLEIVAKGTPKHDYYYTSPFGNRLFSLALGELGRAFCASTGDADHTLAENIFSLPTAEFNREWLKLKKMEWATELIVPDENNKSQEIQETV